VSLPARYGLLAGALVLVALTPRSGSAQEGCILGQRGNDVVDSQVLPGIGRVTYISNPHFVCDRGVEIFADSAVAYGDRGMSHLMGSVHYTEDRRELRAAEARYFSNEGRLQAEGDVIVVDDEQGSSIRDGDLVYLLQTEFREESEMTVTTGADGIRPTAVLTPPPDTTRAEDADETTPEGADARPPEPYRVVADRIFLQGSGYFTGSGDVVIERDSLFAYADSAEYDQDGEGLALVGGARVVGSSYELTGRRITMADPGGPASEVRALREARLTGEDVDLTAARIVVVLREGDLERLVATPLGPDTRGGTESGETADSVDLQRPEAYVQEFVLDADSLEVRAPGERLQRVFAAGDARSVSTARDSLNTDVLPEIARRDWLEGDTVIIRFAGAEPVPPLMDATPEAVPGLEEVLPDSAAATDSAPPREGAPGVVPTPTADSAPVTPVVADTLSDVEADTASAAAESPSERGGDAASASAEIPSVAEASAGEYAPPAPDLAAVPDTGGEREVEEIIARVGARSLYRLPPSDSTFQAGRDAPAVHYVVGDEIRIHLERGEVLGMTVTGQTRGVHLEPLGRSARTDSAAVPDSAVAGDTSVVADTAVARDTSAVADTSTTPLPTVERTSQGRFPPQPSKNPDGSIRPQEEHPWIRR